MPVQVQPGGPLVDLVGVFQKKGGVYAAAAGVSVKVAGAYVSIGAGSSSLAKRMAFGAGNAIAFGSTNKMKLGA